MEKGVQGGGRGFGAALRALPTAVAPWAGGALAASTSGYIALFLLLAVLGATATDVATLE